MKLPIIAINKPAMKARAIKAGVYTGLAIGAMVATSIYFEHYRWSYQSPVIIKLQSPLIIEARGQGLISPQPVQAQEATPAATPSPSPTPQAIKPQVSELVKAIHTLESSNGTNKAGLVGYCESQGKTNEYGYRPYAKHCFNSEAEAQAKIAEWLIIHLDKFGGDVAKTLCYYNLGEAQVNCKYYQDYLNL